MALKCTTVRSSSAIMQEFIDPSYLSNKRPAMPGGAWPKDLLRQKSFADLQQLWFALVKERNMLSTTKHHYVVHQEELGAFPAPTRIQMVDESMANIKSIVQERDFEATDRAVAIFRERMAKGMYRYPPGPQPPSTHNVSVSMVQVILSKKVSKERLRELFGKYDVFEEHKGISQISLVLSSTAKREKYEAEKSWNEYMLAKRKFEGYHAFDSVNSIFDHSSVELAPGVYSNEGSEGSLEGAGARAVDVKPPHLEEQSEAPTKPLDRLQWLRKPFQRRENINYSYYPVRALEKPSAPMERPVHPDEIEGPWVATILYDSLEGYGYAVSLGINNIDGAEVLHISDVAPTVPYAFRTPSYNEARRVEQADNDTAHNWPHIPEWKDKYVAYSKKKLADIIMYNYSNVVDYVDREVLLTGKSSWEMPIPIDSSCGGAFNVPAHAKNKREKRFKLSQFSRL